MYQPQMIRVATLEKMSGGDRKAYVFNSQDIDREALAAYLPRTQAFSVLEAIRFFLQAGYMVCFSNDRFLALAENQQLVVSDGLKHTYRLGPLANLTRRVFLALRDDRQYAPLPINEFTPINVSNDDSNLKGPHVDISDNIIKFSDLVNAGSTLRNAMLYLQELQLVTSDEERVSYVAYSTPLDKAIFLAYAHLRNLDHVQVSGSVMWPWTDKNHELRVSMNAPEQFDGPLSYVVVANMVRMALANSNPPLSVDTPPEQQQETTQDRTKDLLPDGALALSIEGVALAYTHLSNNLNRIRREQREAACNRSMPSDTPVPKLALIQATIGQTMYSFTADTLEEAADAMQLVQTHLKLEFERIYVQG
jgi:hypothetical protein